jgi:trk system potassium uptake protein TrkA
MHPLSAKQLYKCTIKRCEPPDNIKQSFGKRIKRKTGIAMKIIIAGAGAVGTHLAKLLSRERQDIILIDDNEEKLSALGSNFDLMTVCASPSSISGLKEVGASEADLFIAVTPDESRNMTACMIASNLGAKKTVARIDNYEYLLPKNKEFFQKLGVDSLIYPEMLAAKEIVSSMRMSWIRQWWEFCGGALILIGTKMRESAEILNISLQQLGSGNNPYHIVAIKRGNETIIPRGSDVIKLHDIVYFTTTRKYIPYIRKIAGKEDYADVRNVMIMGGGRIAVRTAQYVPDYMQVKIVEQDVNRCNRLTELLDDKVMIINGDGRDLDLLTEEGLKNTEAFVALTGNSETNILACLAAKRMGVSKTVAEVENIDYIGMAESLDIGTVINKKMIAAGHIYQMMLDADVSNVKSLTFANADVAEFTVKADSKITRHHVKDLGLPKGTTIGGLIRDGVGIVVTGDTLIHAGDHVVVFCLSMMIKKIEKFFN